MVYYAIHGFRKSIIVLRNLLLARKGGKNEILTSLDLIDWFSQAERSVRRFIRRQNGRPPTVFTEISSGVARFIAERL